MSVRRRLALVTALAVFACVTLAGGAAFALTARALIDQAEDDLARAVDLAGALRRTSVVLTPEQICAELAGTGGGGSRLPTPTDLTLELTRPDGSVCRAPGAAPLGPAGPAPVPLRVLTGVDDPVARSPAGANLLVRQTRLEGGWQLRAGRDLRSEEEVFQRVRGAFFVLSVLGALLALGVGRAVARSGLRPVAALAAAAEEIARTQDLTVRTAVGSRRPGAADDEVARLAEAFDRMTAALLAARERQARLVADAGHELRTPLTSLRTNVDLLLRSEASGRPVPADQRRELLADLRDQLEELGTLATELTVLAHDEPVRPRGPVRLDGVVRAAADRARRRADGHTLEVDVEPWLVPDADAASLERAVVNLLDNAVKFSPPGSAVRVRLREGLLTVDDQGPGVAPADRAAAFERFWRSDDARSLPGSGLGLAIVADAVREHGGTSGLDDAPGGGARVWFDLPGARPPV